MMEVYETRAAFEQNAGQQWFADYMREAMPLIEGQPDVHMAQPVWVK